MAAIKSSGNVFADLGFNAEEAANLKLRSQLMIEVDKALIEKKTDTAGRSRSPGDFTAKGKRSSTWQGG